MERVTVPAEEGVSNSPADQKTDNAKTVEEVVGRPEWLPENFDREKERIQLEKNREESLRAAATFASVSEGEGSSPEIGEEEDDLVQ